jgi:hypothetical protein
MIWSGFGCLVPVIVCGSVLICGFVFDVIYEPRYYEAHHWTVGVAMFCAAITCWLLDAALGGRKPTVLIDKLTGEKVAFRRSHSLLFIPLHFWALGLAVIGAGFCVREFMK